MEVSPFAMNFTKVCEAYKVVEFKECCEKVIPCLDNHGHYAPKEGSKYDDTASTCEASMVEEDKCYLIGSDYDGEEEPDFLKFDVRGF